MPRVDAASTEQARRQLAACSPAPSVILDEGDRLTGVWLMVEPPSNLGQLERMNRALAHSLGGDYMPPQEALLAVPSTRNTGVYPAHTVEIIAWEPHRKYPLGALALP